MRANGRAEARLRGLFPRVGPWTAAALWFGRGERAPVPDSPLVDELETLVTQRLAALLLDYARESGARVDEQHRAHLQRASFEWTSTAVRAAGAALPVVASLRESGIDVVVSKGPGIGRWYSRRVWRPYSDIDLVVDADAFTRCVRLLESQGWAEDLRNRQPRRYVNRFCREGLNLRLGAGSIDVHHRFPPWLWSEDVSFEVVAARAEPVAVGGGSLPCLAAVDNLLVAALHVVSDRNEPGRSLLIWRDIVELAAASPVADAVRAAMDAGLAGWLRMVIDALPAAVRPQRLADALPEQVLPHPRRLAALLGPDASRFGVIGSQILRLPIVNGAAYAAGMLVPETRFVREKYPEAKHPYREWWTHRRDIKRPRGAGPRTGAGSQR